MDYQAIKAAISVEQAIDALRITITKQDNPNQLRAKCPHCKNGDPRSLSMNIERNVFTCFANKPNARGDVIALVAHVRGTGQKEAAEWLLEQFPQRGTQRPQSGNNSKGGARKGKSTVAIRLIQTDQLKPVNDNVVEFATRAPEDDWTC